MGQKVSKLSLRARAHLRSKLIANFSAQVSFHFVYPLDHPMKRSEAMPKILSNFSLDNCDQNPLKVLEVLSYVQVS